MTRLVFLLVGLMSLLLGPSHSLAQIILKPDVTLSDDETVFYISYGDDDWYFYRPSIPQTTFEQKNWVYWVSPDGDNANPGTESEPFQTINRAIEVLTAGDILYIKAGTYLEQLDIEKSGNPGFPIIISAAPGAIGKVKLSIPEEIYRQKPGAPVIRLSGVQYLWINGLMIEGTRNKPNSAADDDFSASGIQMPHETGLGVQITNNIIYNNLHCGIKGGTDQALIEGNVIFDNGTDTLDHGIYGSEDDVKIIGNIIFRNTGFAIHNFRTPSNQIISHNVIFENGIGGIVIGGSDNIVTHNVSVNNNKGITLHRSRAANNIVLNNILIDNRFNIAHDDRGGEALVPSNNNVDYNLYYPADNMHPRAQVGDEGVYDDPLFVNAELGDYRLQSNSPAIDAGANIGLEYTGSAPDLGAFEYLP